MQRLGFAMTHQNVTDFVCLCSIAEVTGKGAEAGGHLLRRREWFQPGNRAFGRSALQRQIHPGEETNRSVLWSVLI